MGRERILGPQACCLELAPGRDLVRGGTGRPRSSRPRHDIYARFEAMPSLYRARTGPTRSGLNEQSDGLSAPETGAATASLTARTQTDPRAPIDRDDQIEIDGELVVIRSVAETA